MGSIIYSILVEPKKSPSDQSGVRAAFGLFFSSPESAGPWSKDQTRAVRDAVAAYLELPADMDPSEHERKIDAMFSDPCRFEFYITSDEFPDDHGDRADRLHQLLCQRCEPLHMVVHMIITL